MTDRQRAFADAAQAIEESVAMAAFNAIVRGATLSGSPFLRMSTLTLRQAQGHPERSRGVKGSAYVLTMIAGCVTHAPLVHC